MFDLNFTQETQSNKAFQVRLFEFNKHLHFEIANMARCSAFGFTNASHEV